MITINKNFIKGSFILLIVFNVYSFLNFIFQASMARTLSIADYGILAALFYLIYVLSIFTEAIQTVFARQSSREKDNGKLKNLLNRSFKKLSSVTVLFFIVYLIFAIPFSYLESIPYTLLALNGLFIFTALFLPLTRGIMQGRQKFYSLGINLIIESSVKLVASVALVLLGWKVYGAIGGALLGSAVALFFSFPSIKSIYSTEEKKAETIEFRKDSISVFLITFSILAFYTIDLFIAQLVFTKEVAGLYSLASVLSKAVFWGTQPISRAMFPISAEEGLDKKKSKDHNTYLNALILLTLGVAAALILFFLIPDWIIRIFAGKFIDESANILFYLGLATGVLSFANLNVLYKISKNKPSNKSIIFFFAFLLIGIILLFLFNDSLLEFSIAFLTSSVIFLWGSIAVLD